MTVTIVETGAITGGVDTHADAHVAAALDPIGGLLGVQEFPATAAGYASLLDWLGGFGTVCLVGIEGTGSYGAGLARRVTAAGIRVVEVDRSDRQDRRRAGKSDPLDAVSAARAAQSGRARGAPKGRDGAVEAIRALMVAKRSARAGRTQTINQARALILTGPDDLRARFPRHAPADLVVRRQHALIDVRAVRAILGARVVAVGGGQNAAGRTNRIAGQAARITAAVETLMVLTGKGAERREAGRERQHPLRQVRMQPDALKLGLRQLGRLVPDRIRDPETADVMDQRGPPQHGHLSLRQPVGLSPHP